MDLKERIATEMEAGRNRSLTLLEPLSEADQVKQHSPIMSPLVWDLAHVGNYEELWLLQEVAGIPTTSPDIDGMYDAFEHPRAERTQLPLLPPSEARVYIANVRGRVFDVLEKVEFEPARPLVADGYVYGMIVQHEHMHDETMLATLNLMDGEGYRPVTTPPPRAKAVVGGEVLVAGGPFVMGTGSESWAYDNEKQAHTVNVAPFWIDVTPVTNAQYIEFVEAGGYDDPRFWDARGWKWRTKNHVEMPQFWERDGAGSWSRTRFGWLEPLPPDEPAQHVCWYEADAFARWAGKRLPTEAEWEKAASWSPAGKKIRYPWGNNAPTEERANLGQRHFGPASIGAYPGGASPWGCHHMIGDVWEWTSSDFLPYPGFTAFPYPEYSEVFFGPKYKVLRGGSWATHQTAVRNTFRNWDFPIRRQIFAGFRCARDA
ncbi:MAG: ergothioneine biosynthesis protein EgtB [Actinomycetota bacterium]|nr:ergothioneine biosynthesis protein EgtB [Actinomycetota bacterium]